MATGNDRYLTDLDIRTALRDIPEANKLLDDYEFTPEEIRSAQTLCIDYYNEALPILRAYDYTEFPYRYHMLKGTVANLLFMAAHSYRRNHLQYNIPGGAIAPDSKSQEYEQIAARLWEEYKLWVTQTKRAENINQGFGQIG